jgi:hypothetical protein
MELVARKHERSRVGKIETEAQQRGRLSGQAVDVEATEQLDLVAGKRLPVERDVEVVRYVGAEILTRGYGGEGVLQLVGVHVNGDVAAAEEPQAAGISR